MVTSLTLDPASACRGSIESQEEENMPRIYDGHSDPFDFCKRCFPSEEEALAAYGAGEGPDGRGNCFGWNAEHPDYQGEKYRCCSCGRLLRDGDN